MKKVFVAAICLLPLFGRAQQAFTLKGKMGSLNAPAKAYLKYKVKNAVVTDSAELKNGSFEFKGTVDEPVLANISVKRTPIIGPAKGMRQDGVDVYLENTTIIIDAAEEIRFAKITGSKLNGDYARLNALLKPINTEISALDAEYSYFTPEQQKDDAVIKRWRAKYDEPTNKKKLINIKFAEENRNSYIGLMAFRSSMGSFIDPKIIEPAFMQFPADLRNTEEGKKIAKRIADAKKIYVGMVTDFTQNDPEGKPVKLSDFKGKYVLVDFWASWCGPCRAENPNVVLAYNKFKDKNFTVIGVSLDQPGKKDAWLKAIADDKLSWTQVSDLKYWNNEVSRSYGVSAIPFNFLVDPTGKVIALNLTGEALQKKLQELLGEKTK